MNAIALIMPDLSSTEFDYARLIAELNAVVGFNDVQLMAVAESLDVSDIQAVFDRAESVFEHSKKFVISKSDQTPIIPRVLIGDNRQNSIFFTYPVGLGRAKWALCLIYLRHHPVSHPILLFFCTQ